MHFGGGRYSGRDFRERPMSDEEKARAPKITKELVLRASGYLKPYWKQFAVVVITIAISAVLGLLPAVFTGIIIDRGLIGRDFSVLWQIILLSFVLFIIANLITVLQSYVSTWISQRIVFDMRNQMYRHLEFMSHKFYTTEKQGDIITRMNSDIGGVQGIISGTMTNIIRDIFVLTATAVLLFSTNWLLAIIGITIIPLFIVPTKKVGRKRYELATEIQKKQDEKNQIINETLSVSGSLLVKIFNKEDVEYEKYVRANEEITRLHMKESIVGRWFRAAIGVFTNMGPKLIYLAAGLLMLPFLGDPSLAPGFLTPTLTVGSVTVIISLTNRLYGPVNQLFTMHIDVTRSMALFQRVFDYFDLPHDVKNKPDAIPMRDITGNIAFENVSFHYIEELPILNDISFEVESGKTLAIVGPSGAGKSTVINLIPRLYDTVSGSVKIDGIDIKDADMFSLRRHIGFVTQDTYLFNGTIKANLLYANEDATDEQLIDACRRAHIHDHIDSLPDKYETIVGNRGLKLSGGEKQRISIARMILKDPKILILDEATSSLDSISESLIQEAIEPLLKNRTSVVIAHRLSTVMAADKIIVLEKGTVVETGVHHELLLKDGVYKELYETQFRRAIDDMRAMEDRLAEEEDMQAHEPENMRQMPMMRRRMPGMRKKPENEIHAGARRK